MHTANCSRKRKTAFTLAEVLITLEIIGIVAAMTMPVLINNSRNKQLDARLKRGYSLIEQALNMHYAQTGERIKPSDIEWLGLKPLLMQQFKIVKDCGSGYESGCVVASADEEKVSKIYKTYNGKSSINLYLFDDGQFILNDGSLIMVNGNIYISIDINGLNKAPNRLGQDLFMFQIDSNGFLKPMGAKGTEFYNENDAYCSLTSTEKTNGAGCTYKALSESDYFKNLPR